jgi:alkylation response protein AidB-like acyl-CoA dehydrogenase
MIVDLLPDGDQILIRDSIAGFLADQLPVSRLRERANFAGKAEQSRWSGIVELGLIGLGASDEQGGAGCSIVEEVLASVELGRALTSPSVLASMLAVHLADDETRAALIAGSAKAAFANAMPSLDPQDPKPRVQLIDAAGADFVILWDDQRAALYPRAACEQESDVKAIDETITLTRATLDRHAAKAVSEGAGFARHALVLLAAYSAGIADATCAMAVEYAKTREQFGQPIGAFQAIKHYCADMATRAEGALAQTYYAGLDAKYRADADLIEAASARLLANQAALANARLNIQIHGGMGFTEEADAHLFLKRAHVLSALDGGERRDQARIIGVSAPN